jgi:hypothetical protein
MSNNEERNEQLNDKLAESLLQVSNLLYKLPPQISITSETKYVTDFFQQASYNNGETMVLDTQTGSLFIDGESSYLRFTVTTTADTDGADFGRGSSANLFNRIVVRSRGGKELTRLEDANLFIKFQQRYNCPLDWFDTVGKSQGYADSTNTTGSIGDGLGDMSAGFVYIIPISVIPFFHQTGSKLLPSQIMEGVRVELSLENPNTAFYNATHTVTSYTITNPVVMWKVYDLADVFKRKINDMAKSQGLNLLHREVFHTIVSANSSQFNFDVKKACSKGLKAMVISRLTARVSDAKYDSMSSEDYKYIKYNFHIGSSYFPNNPLETGITRATNGESYYYTLSACDKIRGCYNNCAVSPASYMSNTALTSATPGNDSMIACDLNKSQVSDMMGMVINNSRSLLADITFDDALSRRLDVFLIHLRAIKVFQANVEVRD